MQELKEASSICPRGDVDLTAESHGWIQWKGTDVCIDLHCDCGYSGHFDGEFFYHYECPKCKTKYTVGQNIRLIKLTAEEIREVDHFKTCELEDDDFD